MKSLINVENLSAGYGGKSIIKDISFSVAQKEIMVTLGSSGCGKTTLLKALLGLCKPFTGNVTLLGVSLEDLDSDLSLSTLKRIGVLFQNGTLLGSLTVEENVSLPLQMHTSLSPKLIREITILKLAQVGLHNALHLFPMELSGGMRKRAALARALALDPILLFCDEPSAGLDPVTASGLDELLLRLRAELGLTIFVITHELLSINKIADKIIFLHNGTMLYNGTLSDAKTVQSGPMCDFFSRKESANRNPTSSISITSLEQTQ